MHPKCAAALADKDGKNLLMFKGRTEVTTRTSGRIYEKKEAAEMRSLIFLINIIHIKHNPPAIHLTGIHHINVGFLSHKPMESQRHFHPQPHTIRH